MLFKNLWLKRHKFCTCSLVYEDVLISFYVMCMCMCVFMQYVCVCVCGFIHTFKHSYPLARCVSFSTLWGSFMWKTWKLFMPRVICCRWCWCCCCCCRCRCICCLNFCLNTHTRSKTFVERAESYKGESVNK